MRAIHRSIRAVMTLFTLAACSGGQARTFVEAAPGVAAPERTVAVQVSEAGDRRCRDSRCAEVQAIRRLLFTGVPGSAIPRAMVPNENEVVAAHPAFFKRLFDRDGPRPYIVRVDNGGEGSVAGMQGKTWIVIVNYDALRQALVREGVVRSFGY